MSNHHDAPTIRPRDGGWVNASVARIIGLMILHRLGIEWFSGLSVLAFDWLLCVSFVCQLSPA